MTLGFTIGDVGACLFPLWLCIDWVSNLDQQTEVFMKAMLKTGVDVLAVLWGQVGEWTRHRQEGEWDRYAERPARSGSSPLPPHQFFRNYVAKPVIVRGGRFARQ